MEGRNAGLGPRWNHGSQMSRRQWIRQSAAAACGTALMSSRADASPDEGIVRTAEAIHQEVTFPVRAKRLYEVLTDAAQFHKMELLSAAMKSIDVNSKPALISSEPGGSFSLFGGYIVGRQIDLVPDRRIVQAWRTENWSPGVYSVVHFEFNEDTTTKLVFDHAGFPAGTAEHLASGWYSNYWEPLRKLLA